MTPTVRIAELEAEVSALRGAVEAQRTLLEGAQQEVKRVAGKLAALEGFLATGECLGCNGTGVPNGMPYACEECEPQFHHEEIEAGGAAGVSASRGQSSATDGASSSPSSVGSSAAPPVVPTVRKRCAGCGDEFNVPAEQNDHARPEHAGDASCHEGNCQNCPVPFQCGPLYVLNAVGKRNGVPLDVRSRVYADGRAAWVAGLPWNASPATGRRAWEDGWMDAAMDQLRAVKREAAGVV